MSTVEKCSEALNPPAVTAELTLPDRQDPPPTLSQFDLLSRIALAVSVNLVPPILHVGLWNPVPSSAGVAMPEAPVHEDDLPPGREHQVRPPRQVLAMKAIAVAQGVKSATDGHFGARVPTPYRLHRPAPKARRFGHCRLRTRLNWDRYASRPFRVMLVRRAIEPSRGSTRNSTRLTSSGVPIKHS